MYYLIYKITNKLDNKIYIGKHKTETKDDDYFGSGLLLGRAVEKHGKENFVKELLFECNSLDEMNQREIDIVDEEFIARPDTYNIMLGGQGGFDYINKNKLWKTDAWLKTTSPNGVLGQAAYRKRLKEDPEFREECLQKRRNNENLKKFYNLGNSFVGKHHTEETKVRIGKKNSKHQQGNNNSNFGNRWITNGSISKLIPKENSLPKGFKKGRV